MKWYKNHKLAVTLCSIIVLIVVLAIISRFTNSNFIVFRALRTSVMYVEEPLSNISNSIGGSFRGIFHFNEVKKENELLKKENDELKLKLNRIENNQVLLSELRELKDALAYKESGTVSKIMSGDIISDDGNTFMSSFTINLGSNDGVAIGDTVIAGAGVVGKVNEVGKTWAKVTALIDESSKITFAIKDAPSILGIINSSNDGKLHGYLIDSSQSVSDGDLLVTTGIGSYPKGFLIGRVIKVTNNSNSNTVEITVKPEVDFNSLKKVSVVKLG